MGSLEKQVEKNNLSIYDEIPKEEYESMDEVEEVHEVQYE